MMVKHENREGLRKTRAARGDRRDAWAVLRRHSYAVSGMVGIGIVVAARLLGLLQPLEWAALDWGLRWRSPEPMDDRITIVGINEDDIQTVGAYPIPDGVLADLLWQLQGYEPRIIGLDLVRDLPFEPGHGALVEAFQSMENVIGAESVVPDQFGTTIDPPPSLTPSQVGFIDNIVDEDGHLRRSLLGASTIEGDYQFSMALRLAMAYLAPLGIELDNGIRDPAAMRFGAVELPRLHPNSGGYVRADAGGNQILLNFRSGPEPFRMVSLTEVMDGSASPDWLRDRVVLIGVTTGSAKDFVQTSAVASANRGVVFGVEAHAHATSQLLSAVLDGRSLLHVWPSGWEYGWIILWGAVGLMVSYWLRRWSSYLIGIFSISAGLVGIGYVGVLSGWWLPIVPALLAFLLNGAVLHGVYWYHRTVQSRIHDRQAVIEQTFTTIHNGPLQTLAGLIRDADQTEGTTRQFRQDLQQLNGELRSVYDAVQKEVVQKNQIYLPGRPSLDLDLPLHELLYEVYADTLRRNFPNFNSLKANIVTFEPFDEHYLSSEQKRGLCRFLEEVLCNVGKHATGATRLVVECHHDGTQNVIRVIDNGDTDAQSSNETVKVQKNIDGAIAPPQHTEAATPTSGRGTQQAEDLAAQLRGTFGRSPHDPKGMRCELTWQPTPPMLHQMLTRLQKLSSTFFSPFKV